MFFPQDRDFPLRVAWRLLIYWREAISLKSCLGRLSPYPLRISSPTYPYYREISRRRPRETTTLPQRRPGATLTHGEDYSDDHLISAIRCTISCSAKTS